LAAVDLQATEPILSFVALESIVVSSVISSAFMSFTVAMTFHKAIYASETGVFVTWKSRPIIAMVILTFFHVGLVIAVSVLFLIPTALSNVVDWNLICALFFALFKFFVSVYFAWAQCVTMKYFRLSSYIHRRADLRKMGRRLGVTSVINLFSLAMFAIASTKLTHRNHGWILFGWCAIPLSLTAIAEIQCVPNRERQTSLQASRSKIGSPNPRLRSKISHHDQSEQYRQLASPKVSESRPDILKSSKSEISGHLKTSKEMMELAEKLVDYENRELEWKDEDTTPKQTLQDQNEEEKTEASESSTEEIFDSKSAPAKLFKVIPERKFLHFSSPIIEDSKAK
jgi:hypothetical protein